MKKIYLSILASMLVAVSFATVHTVTNSVQTFTPDSINISVGDSIDFSIGGSHDVQQYEEKYFDNGSTFASNNTTSNGFSLGLGGGVLGHTVFFIPGTYYYVCAPHFDNGMKAKIVVEQGVPVAACSEPFFSQYMEGSSNNKAIEIYNPTTSAIDLADYSLIMYNNGGNQVNTFTLTGMLAADETFVIAHSSSINAAEADVTTGSLSHNGDDAYALVKIGVGAVDIIGYFDEDPGSSFAVAGGSTANKTLTRMSNVNAGNTDWSTAMNEWNVTPSNDTVGFGSHDMTPCLVGPVISFKTDSFEFNEADGAIHLDTLLINPAIASPVAESFEIHLDAASTADASDFSISVIAPVTLPFTYNFAVLPNFTAQALDATLVDDALIEGDEWFRIVLRNGANGLNVGADSTLYVKIIDNDFPADTFVELSSNTLTVNEGDASFDIDLDYQQTGTNSAHTVDLMLVTGDVADVDNFSTMTATFNTLTEKFTVNITDDLLVETDEVFTFALTNATNGLFIGSDSIFTLTIEDNEIPTFTLDLIDGNDATGASSAGVSGRFVGVVNSLDRGFNALEFSIQDANGSVDVYSNAAPFSTMSVTVGDEVEIYGTIGFFAGMVRIEALDSMNVLSTGNVLTPVVVTEINDANESDLVRMNELTLVDPAQWFGDNTNAGFDVQALDQSGDTVIIRIDRDYSDLYSGSAPNSGMIDVIGIASQYDPTAPHDENHQIIPRDFDDIILYPTLNFNAQGATVAEDAGTTTIDFTVANDNGGSYTVDVALTGGNGTADDIGDFATQTGVVVSGGTGSITVTITDDETIEGNEGFEFTISNPSAGLLIGNANKFELTITDNDADAITEINVNDLKLYPNPATEIVTLDLVSNESQIATLNLYDALGRTVISKTYILNFGNNSIQMNLGDTAKGNYTLEIATEAGKHTEKIMIK